MNHPSSHQREPPPEFWFTSRVICHFLCIGHFKLHSVFLHTKPLYFCSDCFPSCFDLVSPFHGFHILVLCFGQLNVCTKNTQTAAGGPTWAFTNTTAAMVSPISGLSYRTANLPGPYDHQCHQWLIFKACRWPIPLKDRFPSNISPLQWRWRRLSIIKSSGSTAFQRTPSPIMPLSSHLDYGDTTSSYHSQFNGQVERLYQEISLHLRFYCSCDQHRWSEFLPCTEYALIGAFPHWSHTLQMCFRIPTSFVSMVRQALRHPSMIGSVKAGACSTVCWCNSRELYNINTTRLINWDAPT